MRSQGVGMRACNSKKTGFSYSSTLNRAALFECVRAISSISQKTAQNTVNTFKHVNPYGVYNTYNPLQLFANTDKIFILHQLDSVR